MNHTADKVFDYCDVLGFQISGGKKPYDVSVHSYGVPLYNATLGGDDDVFLFADQWAGVQESIVCELLDDFHYKYVLTGV